MNSLLPREFYLQPVLQVAQNLIGKTLVRMVDGNRLSGLIYEVEAYDGEQDLACHACAGKTHRNSMMYERGGFAYVYFTYGMHWMLNCVCGERDYPAAALIRAIKPLDGLEMMRTHRPNVDINQFANGPAKLTKALAITGALNGADLCDAKSVLFIENTDPIYLDEINSSTRIGIERTPEPWRSKPWRFFADPEKMKVNR